MVYSMVTGGMRCRIIFKQPIEFITNENTKQ